MRHKCLASFIIFCLFFSIICLISLWQARFLVDANFINKALSQSGIYNNVENIAQTLNTDNPEADLQSNVLIEYFAANIEPRYLQTEIEKNTTAFINYLQGRQTDLNVSFNLKPFKDSLEANPYQLEEIIAKNVSTLKDCPSDIELKPNEPVPNCIPKGYTKEQYKNALIKGLNTNEIAEFYPDTYNLSSSFQNPDQTFESIRTVFFAFKLSFGVFLILTFILLGILAILGRKHWPSILRWTGAGLAIPSGLMLLMDLVWGALGGISNINLQSGLKPETLEALTPLINTINTNSLIGSLFVPGTIFILGLVLIILSYALPHPPEPE